MNGNTPAVYFLIAKADMGVSLRGEGVEICHLEGPCPILFSSVSHTGEVRVHYLAIYHTIIYGLMSLSSVYFLSTRGISACFYCAAGLCGSPWMLYCWHFWLILKALVFHSSCFETTIEIVQQANCVDLVNSLFFFCYLGLFISTASWRWGTLAGYLSRSQDRFLYHLSICWMRGAEEPALKLSSRRDWANMLQLGFHTRAFSAGTCPAQHFQQQRGADGGRTGKDDLLKLQLPPFHTRLSRFPVRLGRNKPGGTAGRIFSTKSLLEACSAVESILYMKQPQYHLYIPVLPSTTWSFCGQPRSTVLNSSAQRPVLPLFPCCTERAPFLWQLPASQA